MKKILLTLSSTFFYFIFYYLKQIPKVFITKSLTLKFHDFIPISIIVIGIVFTIYITKKERIDSISSVKSIVIQDNSLVPTYIGYFFLSFNANAFSTMISYYIMIFIFILFTDDEYFNPILLIMGYHNYKVIDKHNIQCTLILKFNDHNIVRDPKYINKLTLYRINNTSFLGKKDIQ